MIFVDGENFFPTSSEETAEAPDIPRPFLDSLEDNTAILDGNGDIVLVNSSWKKFALANGLNEDPSMIGRNYVRIARRADNDLATRSADELENVLSQEKESFELDYPCHSPDEKRWFRMRARGFELEGEYYVTVTHTDVTEEKLRKLELEKNQERFQLLASNLDQVFWIVDSDYEDYEYLSPYFEELWGRSRDCFENLPEDFFETIHPDDRDYVRSSLLKQTQGDYDIEYRIQQPDGEVRWIRDRAFRVTNDEGELVRVAGISEDITERRKTEKELKEQLEFLDSINDRMPGVAFQLKISPEGDLSFPYISQGYETISGISAQEAMDDFSRAFENVHPDDEPQLRESMTAAGNGRDPWTEEFRVLHPDGSTKWLRGSSLPDVQDDGSVLYSGVMIDITKRKQLEQDLRDETTRHELAQEIADLGHWAVTLPDREVKWSDETYRIFGLDPVEDSGLNLEDALEFYHPDDREVSKDRLEEAFQTGSEVQFEARIQRPDGELRHIKVLGVPRTDGAGDITELFGVVQDITDFKETQTALRESERRFRQLAENIDEVFWISDPDTEEMIYVSPAYENIWGRSTESLYENPRSFLDAIHPDDRERVKKAVAKQKNGDYDVEYRIQLPDGEVRWIRDRAFPIENDEGEVFRIVGIAEDITETKTLQRERKKFVELVEHSPNFIARANLDGKLTYVNEAGLEMVGAKEPDELLGRSFEVLHPESDLEKHYEVVEAVKNGTEWSGERKFLNQKTEEISETLFNAFMIDDPETEEPLELAAVATDITDQIEVEEQLRKMVREKETLLQEVHHRVKNNLQVVLGLLGLQARKLKNDEARGALENSKRRIQSMAMIHQKLYEGAQISTIDFPEYVEDLLQQILQSYQDHHHQDVTFNTHVQPAHLDPDSVISCGLIINELVTNSLKHAFDSEGDNRIDVEFFTDENMNYHLLVGDNGRGVDPDTFKDSNSLGMRLVRNLAENQLHGEIKYSQVDGLEVEIVFPPAAARYD